MKLKTNTDSRFFKGDIPCFPHKNKGIKCNDCSYYSKYENKILIIKRAAIGDVLRTTSILKSIKDKYPNCHITWITEPSAAPLLENNSLVDRVMSDFAEYIPMLFIEKFFWVINPDTDYKSCLLATLASAENKSGFILNQSGVVVPHSNAAEEWFQMGIWDDKKRKSKNILTDII